MNIRLVEHNKQFFLNHTQHLSRVFFLANRDEMNDFDEIGIFFEVDDKKLTFWGKNSIDRFYYIYYSRFVVLKFLWIRFLAFTAWCSFFLNFHELNESYRNVSN